MLHSIKDSIKEKVTDFSVRDLAHMASHLPKVMMLGATVALAQSWRMTSSVSAASPDAVASVRAGCAAIVSGGASAVTELGKRVITPTLVAGGCMSGACVLFLAPVVIHALTSIAASRRRTDFSREVEQINQRAKDNAERRWAERKACRSEEDRAYLDPPEVLMQRRAKYLRHQGTTNKALAERQVRPWAGIQYLCSLAAPLLIVPQIGLLVGAPAALPAALALGATGCAVWWCVNRCERQKDVAHAGELLRQSDDWSRMALQEENLALQFRAHVESERADGILGQIKKIHKVYDDVVAEKRAAEKEIGNCKAAITLLEMQLAMSRSERGSTLTLRQRQHVEHLKQQARTAVQEKRHAKAQHGQPAAEAVSDI